MKSMYDRTNMAGMTLKNRFIRSATYEGFATEDGHLTEKLMEIYENLSKGGVGTIITGLTYVSDNENVNPGQMGIYDDAFIDEYHRLTDLMHDNDTRIIMQLVSNGSQAPVKAGSGKVNWGPSEVEDLVYKTVPKEMTLSDIKILQKAFADAAYRAKCSGFDGVQIHAAHGYLLNRFVSPYYNHRTDKYGGSQENRSRMVIETYKEIRKSVGSDYPVLIKINSEDFMDKGMSYSDCKYICNELIKLGIDAIEISGGSLSSRPNEGTSRMVSPDNESYFRKYAAEIAKDGRVPIILVGGNRNIDKITELINTTNIDYISLSRPFIRESNLVSRWEKDTSPSKCISCNKCFTTSGTICIFNK